MSPLKTLDLISIGRSSVDLYGEQVGGRLEDMATFSKAVGGSPTNIAIGTARLGLKSGLITRVGDEHMGRFIREQLEREGVNTQGVHTDKDRLTALVILGIRDDKQFPLIFYRDNCADNALDESDIDEAFIASSRSVVVTGTHFAKANTAAAQKLAMQYAKKHGGKIAIDIDYRPNLWGLAGHGAGEERYIKSGDVTAHLQPILADCDLIVGTEEEIMIAGGEDTPLAALKAVRRHSNGTIVMKRGPMGCVVFPGAIPDDIEEGIKGPGYPVEVYNVLGAGDAFMSGNLGMILITSVYQRAFLAAAKDKFEVRAAMMPTFGDETAKPTNSGSALFIMSKDPAKQRAAWELMKFMTSKRGYTVITSKIGYLPLRLDIVDDPAYLGEWTKANPLVRPNLAQLERLNQWVAYPGANYKQISRILVSAANEAVFGEGDVGKVMREAPERAQALMPKGS